MNEIKEIINKYIEDKDFTGGVSEERVTEVEKELGVKLPKSYRWFLKEYGHGGVLGIEILGCALRGIDAVVEDTEELRDYGMGKELVMIENLDESKICLSTGCKEVEESVVVEWDMFTGEEKTIAKDFFEYLKGRIKDIEEYS